MISVVMLVNEFPPLPAGGAEKQAERLAESLALRGFQIGVLTRGAEGLPARQQCAGYWVERIPQFGPGRMKTVTFMLGAALALLKHRRSYDILHAHLAFSPAVIAAIVGRLLDKPVIVKFGTSGRFGDIYVSQQSWRGRLRLALLRRWVDVNIALGGEMEAELLAAGFNRQQVRQMVNGIDANAFRPTADKAVAKSALSLTGKTTVLFVGRLTPQKALPVLLQALHKAVADFPQLHLLVLGQGSERATLLQQIAGLELADHVTLVGNVTEVRPYLNAADMFVLPSLAEGISNALLEAMASGLPCIATTVGATSEVLEGGACGILVPPNDAESLRLALIKLAGDPVEATRLGQLARERILSHYAFSIVDDQYQALYEGLLNNR